MEEANSTIYLSKLISKKWGMAILRELSIEKDRGFNSLLKKLIPISSKTLANRLKEFEKEGLITKVKCGIPILRVQYNLTNSGREIIKCFDYIAKRVKIYKLKV